MKLATRVTVQERRPARRRAGGATSRIAPGLPAAVLVAVALVAAVGAALTPVDPTATVTTAWATPNRAHPLGADGLGRDVLSRVLAGGWPILFVPAAAVTVASTLGGTVALALAVTRGRGRRLVQVLDVFLVVPPLLLFALIGFAVDRGALALIAIVVALMAPFSARHLRAAADPLLDRGYVEVALASGRGRLDIAVRELLPNLRRPLLAEAGTRFVGAIYLVASASYLGITDLPGDVDWASMVAEGVQGGAGPNPIAVLVPIAAIGTVTVTVNLAADRWSRP